MAKQVLSHCSQRAAGRRTVSLASVLQPTGHAVAANQPSYLTVDNSWYISNIVENKRVITAIGTTTEDWLIKGHQTGTVETLD